MNTLTSAETYVVISGRATAPRPATERVLDVKANFISMKDSQGRVMLSWFWPILSATDQADWEQRWRAAGLSHVVLCPVMQYPGSGFGSADWRTDPMRFAAATSTLLDRGFVPLIEMTSGDGGTGNDVQTFWPGLLAALKPELRYLWLLPGFEVVGPGGGWTSKQLSNGLKALKAANPCAIAVHLQPERATGASHPVEPDDPWHGDEAGFWTSHGGEFADALFYQTPHGSKLLDPNGAGPGVGGWEDRWVEIVDRLGAGALGWRKVRLIFGEVTGFDYFHGNATAADVVRLSQRAAAICKTRGITCGFGNGLPA